MIYFDNSATTRPYREVCGEMAETAYKNFGNPSSLHTLGMEAEKAVRRTRQTIAKEIGAREDEIFFTACGTENANTAIFGIASRTRKRRIITTAVEHPCVLRPIEKLSKEGFEVIYLPVDENGFVSLSELEAAVNDDTALVCMMQVNNEVGAVTDLSAANKIIKRKNPETYFFADCVQGFGKIGVSAKDCDMLSISGHKIHGPKGVGALYVKKGTKINPFMLGGGQERGFRSGTENVPAIAGLGKAVELIGDKSEAFRKMNEVKTRLAERILSEIPDTFINNTDFENSAASVLNISFPGARSEVILHFLEAEEIYVSSGSACSSNKPGNSHVLTAMGKKHEIIDSSVRFSFCRENMVSEADETVETLKKILPKIRRK